MAEEKYTAGKLAEALGISPGAAKKLLAAQGIEPVEVKAGCRYYGEGALKKLKAVAK